MSSTNRPFGPNNIVNYRYNKNEYSDSIVPYKINGKYYPVKLLKKTEDGSLELLGYTNIRGYNIYNDTLYLVPDEGELEEYDYKHGYFKDEYRQSDYVIQIQTDIGNKVRELSYDEFHFHPYPAVKSEAEFLENERARMEELKPSEYEKRLYNGHVADYMRNSNDSVAKSYIIDGMKKFWLPLESEVLLFRGQQNPLFQEIKTQKRTFFSTSLDEHIASHKFTSLENKCCLFVIHAQPGVKYYSTVPDMYEVADKYKRGRQGEEIEESPEGSFEDEVLLEGNGQFFQDKEKTTPGFRELSFEEVDALGLTEIDKTAFGPKNQGSGVKQTTGIFEAYYFPLFAGGRRKRKTRKAQKQKRKSRKQKKSKLL